MNAEPITADKVDPVELACLTVCVADGYNALPIAGNLNGKYFRKSQLNSEKWGFTTKSVLAKEAWAASVRTNPQDHVLVRSNVAPITMEAPRPQKDRMDEEVRHVYAAAETYGKDAWGVSAFEDRAEFNGQPVKFKTKSIVIHTGLANAIQFANPMNRLHPTYLISHDVRLVSVSEKSLSETLRSFGMNAEDMAQQDPEATAADLKEKANIDLLFVPGAGISRKTMSHLPANIVLYNENDMTDPAKRSRLSNAISDQVVRHFAQSRT